MMVDFCISEILERQMLQLLDGLRDLQFAILYIGQQRNYVVFSHVIIGVLVFLPKCKWLLLLPDFPVQASRFVPFQFEANVEVSEGFQFPRDFVKLVFVK
jgi:hypothetical protein